MNITRYRHSFRRWAALSGLLLIISLSLSPKAWSATMVHYLFVQEQVDGQVGQTHSFRVQYDNAVVSTLNNSQNLLNFVFGTPVANAGTGYTHVAGSGANNVKYINYGGALGLSVRGFVVNGMSTILAPVAYDGNYWSSAVSGGAYSYVDYLGIPQSGNYSATGWTSGESGQTGRLLANNSLDAYLYGDGSVLPSYSIAQVLGLNYLAFASGNGYSITYALVPEPSRWLLLMVGATLLAFRRKRLCQKPF